MRTGPAPVLLALLLAGGCGGPARAPGAVPVPRPADDGVPLAALPRQALGAGACGLFLWKAGAGGRLVLMAGSGPPPFARIVLDGRPTDLPRLPAGDAADGLARYGDGRTSVTLDVTVEPRDGLSDGAIVRSGSIRIARAGGDGYAVPVTGILACR